MTDKLWMEMIDTVDKWAKAINNPDVNNVLLKMLEDVEQLEQRRAGKKRKEPYVAASIVTSPCLGKLCSSLSEDDFRKVIQEIMAINEMVKEI